ncbi:SMI1/KNR4 family protein [Shewanella basaltis]|uniref:SMI1/KNR4 family protein n=1 Tax=Shewanella basaltis TaxID=472183 RepID=UPI0020100B57|nr:SMI1/KNR4 family protein [Shewanella basaltis]MCL1115461.1 SMI1/KNR4 family protein [Shewanella basaltis]
MFDKIESILKQKAPLIVEAFQGAADESKIEQLESLIGTVLPNNLKKMYRSRNGFDYTKFANLFYGFPFLELDVIIQAQENLKSTNTLEPLRYADPEIKSDYTFGLKRIPIGDDSGTSLLCVDLDPSDVGSYGQIILVDYDMRVALKLNSSVEELLLQFEDDLINDKYSLQEDALADGVHWLKPSREIDPGNWFNSSRWQYVNTALKK